MIEMFRKEKILDCLGFLFQNEIPKYYKEYISQTQNLSLVNYKSILSIEKIALSILLILSKIFLKMTLKKVTIHQKSYFDTIQKLLKRISKKDRLLNCQNVQFPLHLNQFFQCGSNSVYLLVQMKVDLKNICFEKIKIKNTSLFGANFFRCNLSEQELKMQKIME
ncbi:unnamed protein product [Paramecium pentaurelia]|uniref:Uncharacterized protein n=1 Tax=Paramecium pentaurelia TaxID=43138 RepID=A0A8S1WAJ6_9CILI|nr:unnamed protein product [Paramecium pentaurelia]